MNGGLEDLDLQAEDFVTRVNADLVGKLVNIASRCSGFVHKYFAGRLAKSCDDLDIYQTWTQSGEDIILAYQQRDNAKAMRLIMALADKINQYIDTHKPWSMAKDPSLLPKVLEVSTMALNGFRLLMIYLQPVIPMMATQAQSFLKDQEWSWDHTVFQPLLDHEIAAYEPLLQRLQLQTWEAMIAAGAQ
jgi:methionyl-tRNA synthetase